MDGHTSFFKHSAVRYATSIVAVGVAFLLRHAFSGFFGSGLTYITFSPAVMLAATLGGLGPGLFATALAALLAAFGILSPLDTPDLVGLGLFCALGLFMSLVARLYHQARGRAAAYEKEIALREEQVRVAIETERQRQLLAVTLASIGDGVIVTDAEGCVTFLNSEAERLTGWPSAEAAGRPLTTVFNIVNEYTRQAVENPADKVLRSGVTVGLANHTMLIAQDGRETPIDDSGAPIRLSDGQIQGVVLVFRDFTQRRAAEEALTRAKQEWERTFNSASDLIALIDPQHRILRANKAMAERMGVSPEECIGLPCYRYVHGTDGPPECCPHCQLLADGCEHVAELHEDRLGGDFLVTCTPLQDEQGHLAGSVHIAHDITARKQAEEELRRSERRYRSYVDLTNQFAWVTNPSGEVVDDVPSLRAFTGQTYEEAQGTGWAKALHPDDLQRTIEVWNHAVTTRTLYETEYRMRRHDGVYRTLLARGVPIQDDSGNVQEWVGTCIDITDRKQAEEALRESELFSRQTLESIPGMVFTTRPDGYCDYQSQQWVDYTGVPMAEHLGDGWNTLLHPEDRPRAYAAWRDAVEGRAPYDLEYRVRRHDGAYEWFKVRGRPIRNAAGEIVRWFGVATNIDELKRAENALLEADRRKDEFLAMLAHELRNPLAPVRNAVQVMRLAGPNETILQHQRGIIDRQVTHMARLLDDLLDVSRITRGKITLQKQSIAILDVLAHAAEVATPLIEDRRHKLHLNLPASNLRVDGDLDRLAQVVGNLLTNAAKYTPEGGQIWLEAVREDGRAVVRVRDNGIGIAPEMLPRIFDLFTQADRSLDRSQGGLGIGLTMAQSLVEMHGGSVEACSDGPGQGSEFSVYLPALPEESQEITSSNAIRSASTIHATARRRILVVDDVVDSAETLADLLRLWGHEVDTAHDGPAALETARQFQPDTVLLDIGLPGMNGHEVARRLRAEHRRPQLIVALSGYGQAQDRDESLAAGFDRHLVKPVDLQELETLLTTTPTNG